jgi:hypothetical protein
MELGGQNICSTTFAPHVWHLKGKLGVNLPHLLHHPNRALYRVRPTPTWQRPCVMAARTRGMGVLVGKKMSGKQVVRFQVRFGTVVRGSGMCTSENTTLLPPLASRVLADASSFSRSVLSAAFQRVFSVGRLAGFFSFFFC